MTGLVNPFALSAALAALGFAAGVSAQTVTDGTLNVSPYASGFSSPTQIRFLGPGDLFVTEKNTGRVQHVVGGSILPTPALDLSVANDSERGLLGITLNPNFATNNLVYIYYSATTGADGGAWLENRLSQFVWNGSTLGSETVLQRFGTSSDGLASGPNHDGGPIVFGPDGMLYGITGDLNRDRAEQNNQLQSALSAAVGGVYRLNADGTVPLDNPFTGEANTDFDRWYAYGVRNSYGLAFDPLNGNLWDTENGPGDYDEINLVNRGFNSGWNEIMGPDSRDPQGVGNLVALSGSAYSDPEFSFFSPVAVTGLDFLANSVLDANYRDALLVGDANNGNLYLYRLNAARDGFVLGGGLADLVADTTTERNLVRFGQDFGAVTDIQVGPDGAVYVTSLGDGIIYRIVPEPSSLCGLAMGAALLALRRRRLGRAR
ncbi:MAG: PQQ-dependent sugar dehydrogenase [Verrucomicrobiales bacterium]